MDYVLIIHSVKNYREWKKIFDGAATLRKNAGEQSYDVLRDANDANTVIHFSKWSSIASARAFFESAELVEIRRQAGVEAPAFHYLHLLEQGSL